MTEPTPPTPPKSRAERFQRVVALFELLLELPSGERAAKLLELTDDEPELRSEVAAMLAFDTQSGTAFSPGAGLEVVLDLARGAAVSEPEGEDLARLPMLRGQYRIVRKIGEGGMGVVYEAEQSVPRRRVALKAVRAGFDSRRVLRRFEQEAHILGRLQHQGIAQIYEAGTSDVAGADQAFIAMEFVDGVGLLEWAEKKSEREICRLVADMCDAVQHAHQRRVIHRDLKPGNVLVDATGRAKILDFGVARFSDPNTDFESIQTRAGQLVGTLPYMSPEQVGGDSSAVDARTDVYALGVILYELLGKRLPHPIDEKSLPQMLLAIRDEEPPRLGTLSKRLRGDLEAMTARALAKDKERRYQSAADFGADLKRWLDGDPIAARQDSSLYVLRRQIARRPGLTAAIVVALVSLIAFAITAKLAERRADRDATNLSNALRSSRIERGRLLGRSNNLPGAEKLLWDEHLRQPSSHSHWALWDLYSRFPCVRSLPGHTDSVLNIAVSADGKHLATGSHDRTVRLWDWETGTTVDTLPVEGFLTVITFSGDGSRLFSVEMGGKVTAFDVANHREIWRIQVPETVELSALLAAATARDRELLVVGGVGSTVLLLDTKDGHELGRVSTTAQRANGLAVDVSGRWIAAAGQDGAVHVLDVEARRETFAWPPGPDPVMAVCIDPRDRRIASGTERGALAIHDVESHHELARVEPDNGMVRGVTFSQDGKRLLSTHSNGIDLWKVGDDGALAAQESLALPAFASVFAADGKHFVSGEPSGMLRVFELDPQAAMHLVELPVAGSRQLALLSKGSIALARYGDGRMDLIDFDSARKLRSIDGLSGEYTALTIDDASSSMALAVEDGRVGAWRMDTGETLFERNFGQHVSMLRYQPGGALLVVSTEDHALQILDRKSGETRVKFNQDGPVADKLCFTSDGLRLASGHRGRKLRIWDVSSTRLLREIDTGRSIASLVFDPQDELLFVGTWDGRVQIWRAATGELVRTLEGHALQVYGIVPVPNSRLFATNSADGTVRFWDPDVAECLVALDPHAGPCRNIAIVRDGNVLRVAYDDGKVREWDLRRYDREIEGNAAGQRSQRGLAPTAR